MPTIFLRRTAGRLACGAGGFLSLTAAAVWLLPAERVGEWSFAWPVVPALVAAALVAAWLARWWAETERPAPLAALALHAAAQALLLAPLVCLAPLWLTAGCALAALLAVIIESPRAGDYFGAGDPAAAALLLSAAGANPAWYAGRLFGCLIRCRD